MEGRLRTFQQAFQVADPVRVGICWDTSLTHLFQAPEPQ